MTAPDLQLLNEWAAAWSSHDPGRVLAFFTDDCVYEDVPFGVVIHGKEELRAFATAAFDAVPDLTFQLTNRFAAGSLAAMEWAMSGTHKGDFPACRPPERVFCPTRRDRHRNARRKDPAQFGLLGCRELHEAVVCCRHVEGVAAFNPGA